MRCIAASFGNLLASGPLVCNGLLQYHRDSVRQRETEHVAPCGHCHILHTIHGIGHGRCAHRLARIEVPQRPARTRVDRFEGFAIVPKEQDPPSRRQRPAPGFSWAYLRVTPDRFSIRRGKCQQNLLGLFGWWKSGTGVIKRLAWYEFSGLCEKKITALQCDYVKETSIRIVGRRKPIRSPVDSRADIRAFRRRNS